MCMFFFSGKQFLCSDSLLKLLMICIILISLVYKDLFLYVYAKDTTYKLEVPLEDIQEIELDFPHIPVKFIPPSNQKQVEQFERVIFRDSKIIFSLLGDSILAAIFNTSASNRDVKVQIIDLLGNEFTIDTEVESPLDKTNLIVFKTEVVPKEVAEGEAILLLLLNNEAIGKTTIFVSKSLAEEFEISTENAPFIKSVSIINKIRKASNRRIVKILVGGKNFFRDILLLENPGVKKSISTELSLFPSKDFRNIGSKILTGQEIIINTYLVNNLTFDGSKFILIFHPFGILIEKIKIPKCNDRCGESIQFEEN